MLRGINDSGSRLAVSDAELSKDSESEVGGGGLDPPINENMLDLIQGRKGKQRKYRGIWSDQPKISPEGDAAQAQLDTNYIIDHYFI